MYRNAAPTIVIHLALSLPVPLSSPTRQYTRIAEAACFKSFKGQRIAFLGSQSGCSVRKEPKRAARCGDAGLPMPPGIGGLRFPTNSTTTPSSEWPRMRSVSARGLHSFRVHRRLTLGGGRVAKHHPPPAQRLQSPVMSKFTPTDWITSAIRSTFRTPAMDSRSDPAQSSR